MVNGLIIALFVVAAGVAGYVWGMMDYRKYASGRTRTVYLLTLKGYVIDGWHDGDRTVSIVMDDAAVLPDTITDLEKMVDEGLVRPCVFKKMKG